MPVAYNKTKHYKATKYICKMISSLSVGEQIPLTANIVANSEFSHGTIIQALKKLAEDRVIEKPFGKKCYVMANKSEYSSANIAILRPDFPSEDIEAQIKNIHSAGEKYNWRFSQYSYRDWSKFDFSNLLNNSDATILIPPSEMLEQSFVQPLLRPHYPVIILSQHMEKYGCHNIVFNDYLGGSMGAEALFERGHKKILFILDQPKESTTLERYRGFKEKLNELGVKHSAELLLTVPLQSFETGYDVVYKTFLERIDAVDKIDFSAIFCSSKIGAIAVLRALREKSIHIPEEVAVLAFDGEASLAPYLEPPLSAIEIDTSMYGQYTIELLELLLNQQHTVAMQRVIAPKLVLRKTLI